MRVALSAEVTHTHEELIERILHAGLAYTDAVDQQTSLVVCDDAAPEQGKGYQAARARRSAGRRRRVHALARTRIGGTAVEEFTDATLAGDQFTLF